MNHFFFLPGAWVSAEAATLFAAALDFGLLRILAALEATAFDVTSGFLAMWNTPFFRLRVNLADGNSSLPNAPAEPDAART
jgi:hypothetical protein